MPQAAPRRPAGRAARSPVASGPAPVPGRPGLRAALASIRPPGGYGQPPGGLNRPARPGPPAGHPGVADELVLAFEILVPVKTWLRNPGWRQGLRLLVIAYALLPLVFLALFSSSCSLAVPGFAYSLYVAPLWAIAFWLLVRPGRISRTGDLRRDRDHCLGDDMAVCRHRQHQ